MNVSTVATDAPLAIEDVSVAYGDVQAIDDVTLRLDPGVTALLGPNGAGKTTLFRLGAGVLPPDAGTIRLSGRDPFTDPDSKHDVGYLAHGPALDGRRSVRDNLDFWGRAYGLDASERANRIDHVAERFDFADLLDRDGDALSRGQRQRVALGRALLHDPDVLFLDEPTSGLDPTTASRLRDVLDEVAADRTLLYATHNLHEAAELADDIAFFQNGRLIAHDEVDALLAEAGLSDGRRVAVAAGDDADDVLRELGHDPERENDEWLVTLDSDEEPSEIVSALVERGVHVSEVRRTDAGLDELYRRLEGQQ